jgi:hypothetical protein
MIEKLYEILLKSKRERAGSIGGAISRQNTYVDSLTQQITLPYNIIRG